MEASTPKRPFGVSLLGVFYVLVGLAFVVAGGKTFLGGSYTYQLYVGFVWAMLGWGLWKGKGWAWTLLIIDAAVTALVVVFSALLVPVPLLPIYLNVVWFIGAEAFNLLLVFYATRGNVKAFFGKISIKTEFF